MSKVKIVSNPYNSSVDFSIYNPMTQGWMPLEVQNPDSKLRQENIDKVFLPFKAMEIVNIIIDEYYVNTEKVEIVFQGTTDEWDEMCAICYDEDYCDKVELTRETIFLENARDILKLTKNVFDEVHPIIKNIFREDDTSTDTAEINREMRKVADALDDIIPICVFGNYSAGKSTFINSLIGNEILPSGGDPVTAKIYEIKRSKQQDRAIVSFQYLDEDYRIVFEPHDVRVQTGNEESDIAKALLARAEEPSYKTMLSKVRGVVDLLNSIEKRDKETVISNVIEIEVPFSERGKLGQTLEEFVIFDTPGSNSATNVDHGEVLKDSLESFSNGIPVWVTQYDSVDSVDNAKLCEMLYKIDALDKRFTMIIINKADSAELPRNGLSNEDVRNILEYDSVSRMYAAGIYFVSSIMGLGAKKPDEMDSDFLWEVFEEKERKFSDPSARAYKRLYEYNIMPLQMKELAMDYSQECENIIYANSGLYCVETEMEQFAEKYAAYNKCHSTYNFLRSITDRTKERIEKKTSVLENQKKKAEHELDVQQRELIEKVRKNTTDLVDKYLKESRTSIRTFVNKEMHYDITKEEIKAKDKKLSDEKSLEADISGHEDAYDRAKKKRMSNLIENMKKMRKGKFVESVKSFGETIKTSVSDWRSDSKIMQEKQDSWEAIQKDVDMRTSDEILRGIVESYKNSRAEAWGKLSASAQRFWDDCSRKYREEMVNLIESTESLTDKQKTDASEAVTSFQAIQYDDTDKVFMKSKFLKGSVLGLHFGSSEKLDIEKLVDKYNARMNHVIDQMKDEINHECYRSFVSWQESLQDMIEENIELFNPDLRELAAYIREEEGRIRELRTDQERIINSVAQISDLMAWKNL